MDVPVYFCLGRHDYEVPSALSAQYFEALKAPEKLLVWFESSSHVPNVEEKDKFNEFMSTVVLPALIDRERIREARTSHGAPSGGHAA